MADEVARKNGFQAARTTDLENAPQSRCPQRILLVSRHSHHSAERLTANFSAAMGTGTMVKNRSASRSSAIERHIQILDRREPQLRAAEVVLDTRRDLLCSSATAMFFLGCAGLARKSRK